MVFFVCGMKSTTSKQAKQALKHLGAAMITSKGLSMHDAVAFAKPITIAVRCYQVKGLCTKFVRLVLRSRL
jgi:hypothetical protein